MSWRKKRNMIYDDPATNKLMNKGVYSLHMPDGVEERKFFKLREHNILAGIWYVFILSCLLWWLPLFGQMIAGYIGGRKAGSPIKGLLVAVIPVFIILLLIMGMDFGLLPFLGTIASIPNIIMNGIRSFSPHAASYLSGIYNSLSSLVGLNGNGFIIVVAFGLIGGMMAEMNRKEIIQATGNMHFYDAFLGRFSGASLSKFADMVAERVIWTLGTIDHGSRNLLGRVHGEPSAIGFEELKKLPPVSPTYTSQMHRAEPISYQPERAFGYDTPPSQGEEFMHMENIASKSRPARLQPRRYQQNSWEEEWDVTHRDLSEESLTKAWKEHKRNIDGGKKGQRYGRDSGTATEKLQGKKIPTEHKTKEKRDALIYDGKGNLMNKDHAQKKVTSKPSKKKVPSLVTRALATDSEIKANKEVKTTAPTEEQKNEIKPARTKTSQSYERL